MSLYITGDIHGKPQQRFSFKKNAGLRDLTNKDTMIVLGDFGLPFGINAPWDLKSDIHNIEWLNNRKWTTLAIAGNHDDRDAIEQMPIVKKWGGLVRQMTVNGISFQNIFYVDSPQVLTIQGKKCLIIPGAESHDIDDGILDPEEPEFRRRLKIMRDSDKMYRIKHWTWWENEAVDIKTAKILLAQYKGEHFDLILTHDAPALMNQWYGRSGFREISTEGQLFLEELRKTLDFDSWFHGHFHMNEQYPFDERIMCLFNMIIKAEE